MEPWSQSNGRRIDDAQLFSVPCIVVEMHDVVPKSCNAWQLIYYYSQLLNQHKNGSQSPQGGSTCPGWKTVLLWFLMGEFVSYQMRHPRPVLPPSGFPLSSDRISNIVRNQRKAIIILLVQLSAVHFLKQSNTFVLQSAMLKNEILNLKKRRDLNLRLLV